MANFEAIQLMVAEHVKNKVEFLKELEDPSILCRKKPPESSASRASATNKFSFNWEENERRRILDNIDNEMLKFYATRATTYTFLQVGNPLHSINTNLLF